MTAHGAPLKRAKGSPAESKNTETNEKEALKASFQKNENIFEFSEAGRPTANHMNQTSEENNSKQMEKQNDEDINEELNVDN